MKKHITATILLLSILCYSLGCGSQKVIYSGDTVRFDAEQVGSSYLAHNEYLKHVKEHSFPGYFPLWSQFSALGEFSYAQIYENPPPKNVFGKEIARYGYTYTNPDTGIKKTYGVNCVSLGENSKLTFESKEVKAYLTQDYPKNSYVYGASREVFIENNPLMHNEKTTSIYYFVNDNICFNTINDHNVNGYPVKGRCNLYFIHDNVLYAMGMIENDPDDSDLMRRLFNFDTCEEAVQEIINFQKAQTAK